MSVSECTKETIVLPNFEPREIIGLNQGVSKKAKVFFRLYQMKLLCCLERTKIYNCVASENIVLNLCVPKELIGLPHRASKEAIVLPLSVSEELIG